MSDSRITDSNDDLEDVDELFVDFYKKILPLDSIPQSKTLVTLISDKLLLFLKTVDAENPHPGNYSLLKDHMNRLVEQHAEQHPELKELSRKIQKVIDHYPEDATNKALLEAMNEYNLLVRLGEEIERHKQTVQSNDKLSKDIPTMKIGLGLEGIEKMKFEKGNIEMISREKNEGNAIRIIGTPSIQNYPKKTADEFKPFFAKLSTLFGDQPVNYAFLEGAEIYAVKRSDDSVNFYFKLGAGSEKPEYAEQTKKFKEHFYLLGEKKIQLAGPSNFKFEPNQGTSMLMLAASFDQNIIVEALMKTPDLKKFTFDGKSALHFACQFDQTKCAKLLITSDLIKFVDRAKPNAFEFVVEKKNLELMNLLFQAPYHFPYENAWNKLKEFDQTNSIIKNWLSFFEMADSLMPGVFQKKPFISSDTIILAKIKEKILDSPGWDALVFHHPNDLKIVSDYTHAINNLKIKGLVFSEKCITDDFFTEETKTKILKLVEETPDAIIHILFTGFTAGKVRLVQSNTINVICEKFRLDGSDLNLQRLSFSSNIPFETIKKLYDNREMLFDIEKALNKKALVSQKTAVVHVKAKPQSSSSSSSLQGNTNPRTVSTSPNALLKPPKKRKAPPAKAKSAEPKKSRRKK